MEIDLLNGATSAAAYLGLTRRQVYRLVELDLLPCVKKGRRLYFRKSELEKSFSSQLATIALLDELAIDIFEHADGPFASLVASGVECLDNSGAAG